MPTYSIYFYEGSKLSFGVQSDYPDDDAAINGALYWMDRCPAFGLASIVELNRGDGIRPVAHITDLPIGSKGVPHVM